jgi:succinate-semialdehyde dehydrogenase/glutarate-semialdehyde dehydrogenase
MENPTKISTYNPEIGERLDSYPVHSSAQLDSLLKGSQEAFREWRKTSREERNTALRKLADLLERDKTDFAQLIKNEMGKPIAEGIAEIEKCAACARYYADESERALTPIEVTTEAKRSFVTFEPLGTVLAIMPWNFPFWQVVRCAAPALSAGNAVVLKHASNVTGCALELERLFTSATGKKDLFRAVLVPGKDAVKLISRREISAVSLTGSTAVGREVGAAAGKALKKCVLELGGSDAYVVLADADVEAAAKICAESRMINGGQSCIAAKRFIVEKPVVEKFTELFVNEMKNKVIGPMARRDLRDELQRQVDRSVKQGAKLLCGGKVPGGNGFHYPPTVLAGVKPGMVAFDEELFGPVGAIIEAEDEMDALRMANQSVYGLGAAVFTKDLAKAERIARDELEAGSCFGNALVRSDPRLPFGGIKDSGYGRELAGFGLREFTNVKTIYIDEPARAELPRSE